MITAIWGMIPEARVLRRNIPEYPLREQTPSSIRAPPLSLIMTMGARMDRAIS